MSDVNTPRGFGLVIALWLTMIAPTAEAHTEACATARLIAEGLDAATVKACYIEAEALADAHANRPSAGACLIDPLRSANLHNQGSAFVAATVIELDGSEALLLAASGVISDPSCTYTTSEPPAHECLGALDDVTRNRIWGRHE